MPPRTPTAAGSSHNAKVERARQFLSGGGVNREDSDDELGLEDHPWRWLYSTNNSHGSHNTALDTPVQEPSGKAGPRPRRRKDISRHAEQSGQRRIVGAHMGAFKCMIGDCVLLKAEGTKEAWVGLICEFQEEEDEGDAKAANFMWFSTDKEIRNKQKKRTDALQNELYITPSWDINPLTSINGKASIVSPKVFHTKYPSGKIPRTSKDCGKMFICRRGCNTRTATYTEEFIWEDVFHGTDADVDALIERVKTQTKATRKRRRNNVESLDPVSDGQFEDDVESPKTPNKRRKLLTASTPTSKSSARTPQKFTTPTQKRVVIKKPLEFTPLGTRILSPSHIASSPFQVARTRLHVSSVPTALPCREQEFAVVYSHLEAAISDGSGSCIYISGTPGTGKTATVREVVSQLNGSVLADELDDFIFVEINGLKVTDPHQAYSLLWEALRGDRVSPSHALDLLEREFSNPSPRRVPCVVLMDELDQLVTKNQSVMYNFFNWPGLRHSRLIVLAVANTMDLPERTLSNKISSRLGLTRITFPGYTHDQLMKVIQSRLEGVPGNIVDPDAVQFASRKVAAVSGDARRALDICRRAVEIAESETLSREPLLDTPSKKIKDSQATPRGQEKRLGKVTISTIKQAINEATSSPLQQCLRSLPLASKVFLAATLARLRRTGIGESILGEVIEEAKRIGLMANSADVHGSLLTEFSAVVGEASPTKKTLGSRPPRIIGMGMAVTELVEAGIISLEARKGERTGKIRLNVGEEDLKVALKDDDTVGTLGFSA
ncbi:MAG: origin recognition complex subunit 1 [Lasallia pustulata]|uniref:Origin recognition complex subunit 1 n=1 Tax=Lasallia pustulata TaxID=136370 RepID=A0A5M8PPQ4_9LECA|nr:MAG: origin recognition complex subunit 1 [Lasallia pustulata]